jgi:bifunctional non-homologous end joining protein LigD
MRDFDLSTRTDILEPRPSNPAPVLKRFRLLRRTTAVCSGSSSDNVAATPAQPLILEQRTISALAAPCRQRYGTGMSSLRPRVLPAGFVPPCLPTGAPMPPSGAGWLHEIKHDGFRCIARKTGTRVRLYSRPGNDQTHRFPLIAEALARLGARSCIIDGEAVVCDETGLASFEMLRDHGRVGSAFMWSFDLIELNGDDLRREPLEARKATLARLLDRPSPGLRVNEHLDNEDGPLVFAHACRLGLEGIVSKRRGSPYRSGRTADWIKAKNPQAPAVTREAEEDWGGRRSRG